ncbi:MAG TPA: PTS fructose transporter subunit IIA [Burkholderiales bacterium]|nr:PTS fructose transporter subunit IIA [Burkholderiales bacterium]
MIGILIISHGTLGDALIHAASHVLGTRPQAVRHLGVAVDDDPEVVLPRAQELVKELDSGMGVLVLSDIYGATPGNIALRLLERGRVAGVAGVNLPMLVRVLTYRNEPLATVVDKALSGGREGVVNVNTDRCNGKR